MVSLWELTWEDQWRDAISSININSNYNQSESILRQIVQTGLLKFTDVQKNPERFFLAHRILAEATPRLGPGFWIRFTVQYNLFAGTVVSLGSNRQIEQLSKLQKQGSLGCFGLTERFAGVNSGLIVETTATWCPKEKHFLLNSPTFGSDKNWISQGLVADKCVVIASLIVEGKNYGPHAFLIDFRTNGITVEGIILKNMGEKTTGNDLDNAWIHFRNVIIPKDSLLNRFADIFDDKYIRKIKGLNSVQMIGQRLFTGRVAVAQAALEFSRRIFSRTRQYSDSKKIWGKFGTSRLSDVPQLKSLYLTANSEMNSLIKFSRKVEFQLCKCLRKKLVPSSSLVEGVAVLKILAVESSIKFCFQLKQEVGSYALFQPSGFGELDFLQCCKFAEGDSRILMQKLSRDRIRQHISGVVFGNKREKKLCVDLQNSLKQYEGVEKQKKWDNLYENVYQLAEVICERVLENFTKSESML